MWRNVTAITVILFKTIRLAAAAWLLAAPILTFDLFLSLSPNSKLSLLRKVMYCGHLWQQKQKPQQLQQTLNAGNNHHLKTDNWKIFHSDKKAAIFSEGQSSLIATNEWKSSCHYFFRLLMLWTKSIFRSWLNHSTLHFHLDLSLSLSQSEAATKTFSKKWILTFLALASPQVIRCSNKRCLNCLTVLCLRSKF